MEVAEEFIEVLVPTAIASNRHFTNAPRTKNLSGKVIGIIDNRKPNYDIFLVRLLELLGQRFDFAKIVQVRKGETETGKALAAADINKLAAECNIVLNGICD
jgi:hypothetical protein